jgi:hypothetical protein
MPNENAFQPSEKIEREILILGALGLENSEHGLTHSFIFDSESVR